MFYRRVYINFKSFRTLCDGKSTTCTSVGNGVITRCSFLRASVPDRCRLAKNCKVWKRLKKAVYERRSDDCKRIIIRREKYISFQTLQKYCNEKFKSIKSYKKGHEKDIICGIASKCDFPKHEFFCCKSNCPRWHKLKMR